MATKSLGTLTLNLIAQIGGFQAGMEKAANSSEKNMRKVSKSANLANDAFGALATKIGGPLAAALGVRELVRYADEWTNLGNRLKIVTDSSAALAIAQEDVFKISQNTRQSLGSTAELYQRIATNADQLGLSLTDISAVVETISKTLVISGASAAGASAALVQLGQAFASGTLRGEELNSVLEQAPALAKAIADGLGVTTGQLRELGKEGKLTADQVIAALQKMSTSVDADFNKTTGTVSQAFEKLGGALTRTIGYFNEATGAGNTFARGISNVADTIASFSSGELERLISQRDRLRQTLDAGILTKGLANYASDDLLNQIAGLTTKINALSAARELLANEKPLKFDGANNIADILAGADAAFKNAGKGLEAYTQEAIQARETSEKAAKALSSEIESTISTLEREAAIVGKTADEIAIYDLQSKKAGVSDINRAKSALAVVSAYETQKKVQDDYKQLITDLRTEEEKLTDQMHERLAVLEQVTFITDEARKKAVGKIVDDSFQKAPDYGGLDASVGGAGGELDKINEAQKELEKWYETQLEMLDKNREERADLTAQWDEKELELKKEHEEKLLGLERARTRGTLAASEEFFGNMAALSQSGNKKLGQIGKAAAIAQATISGVTAVVNALAIPPYPVGLALSISAGVLAAANVAQIAGVQFKTGGYTGDMGVNDVAGVVHGQEFVMDAATTARIGRANLEAMQRGKVDRAVTSISSANSGRSGGSYHVTVNQPGVTTAKEARQSSAQVQRDVARGIAAARRYG